MAVKTLKGRLCRAKYKYHLLWFAIIGFVQRESVRDLLKECVKMHELDHPNVLKLIGVCLDGGPAPYIIMPFMNNGSLLSHLKAERENILLDTYFSNLDDIVSTNNSIFTSS